MKDLVAIGKDEKFFSQTAIFNLNSQEILNGDRVGRLACLKGSLSIRDFQTFTEIIPVMSEFRLQLFASTYDQTSYKLLKALSDTTIKIGLDDVARSLEQYNEPFKNLTKQVSPLLKLIADYHKEIDNNSNWGDWVTAITGTVKVMQSTSNLIQGLDLGKTVTDVVEDATNIALEINTVLKSLTKLAKSGTVDLKKKKKPYTVAILASGIGLAASVIGSIDGLQITNKEAKNIIKNAVKTAGEITKQVVAGNGDDKKTFTWIGIAVSAITDVLIGSIDGISLNQTYIDDGIPKNIALKDSLITGLTPLVRDAIHKVAEKVLGIPGIDDFIFEATRFLTSLTTWCNEQIGGFLAGILTNKKYASTSFEYAPSELSYVEWIAEGLKTFNAKNSGDDADNRLIVNEEIIASIKNRMIYAKGGNDYISNNVSNVKVYGGSGNDTIFSNKGSHHSQFYGGPGLDVIIAYDDNNTLYGGNSGNSKLGGNDNDKISTYGNNNKVFGEEGNDFFQIVGGTGNTVTGGLGNDMIVLEGANKSVIEYADGDGNDIIYGFSESDKITISGGYSTTKSGSDVILNVGSGAISLVGADGLVINVNGKKIDTADLDSEGKPIRPLIELYPYYPSVWDENARVRHGTSGDDTIDNYDDNIMIKTFGGNDSIYSGSSYSSNVSVSAGSGNNTIDGYGIEYVSAEDGENYISSGRGSSTIISGSGNDTIYTRIYTSGSSSINAGDGNNYIYVSNEALCEIHDYSAITSGNGNDTILNYRYDYFLINAGNGNNYIELEDAGTEDCTIISGSGNDTILNGSSFSINAGDGNNYIHSHFGGTIISGSGNDTIRSGHWSSINVGEGKNSIISGEDSTIISGNGNDTIDVDKNSLINAGNGRNSIKCGYDSTIISGSGNDTIFAVRGSSINADDGNNCIYGGDDSTIISGSGNDVIDTEYQKYLDTRTASYFGRNGDSSLINAGNGKNSIISGDDSTIISGSGNDTIRSGSSSSINAGNGNNSIISGGKSTIISGSGNDTLQLGYYYNSNSVTLGGGKDVIWGYTEKDTLYIPSSKYTTQSSGNDVIVKYGKNSVTLKNAQGRILSILPSDDIIKTVTNADKSPVVVGSSVEVIDASKRTKAIRITGNSLDNTIKGGSNKDTIFGGAGNDKLFGNSGNDTLVGGTGNDTLTGGKGNDVLAGGKGKDIFVYSNDDGKDIITDYSNGDKIKLTAGKVTGYSLSGKNGVLKVGSGKITLKNIGSGAVTVVGKDKKTTVYKSVAGVKLNNIAASKATQATLTSAFKGKTFSAADYSSLVTVTAAKFGKSIKIVGNAKNNQIYGSAKNDSLSGGASNDKLFGNSGNDTLVGGTGNDTLTGGKGNDVLTGGKGKDIFVYSNDDGKDTITDYTTGQDKIKISSTIKKTSYKGRDVIFTIGKGTLTVKNGKGKKISIVDSSGKTTEKSYSVAALVNSDNFVTADNLSSIIKNNLSSTALEKIETNDFESLTQEKDLITYSGK